MSINQIMFSVESYDFVVVVCITLTHFLNFLINYQKSRFNIFFHNVGNIFPTLQLILFNNYYFISFKKYFLLNNNNNNNHRHNRLTNCNVLVIGSMCNIKLKLYNVNLWHEKQHLLKNTNIHKFCFIIYVLFLEMFSYEASSQLVEYRVIFSDQSWRIFIHM